MDVDIGFYDIILDGWDDRHEFCLCLFIYSDDVLNGLDCKVKPHKDLQVLCLVADFLESDEIGVQDYGEYKPFLWLKIVIVNIRGDSG